MKTVFLLFILVSCGGPGKLYFSVKESNNFPVTDELRQSISYYEINSKVLSTKCLSCHDAGSKIRLDTYESAKKNLKNIEKTVLLSRSMPRSPVKPLQKEDLLLLAAWIKAGGPETPLNGTQVEPEPQLEPNFESIKRHVLNRKCLACHTPGASVERIPLVTKEDLLESNLDIVVPGNPDDSGLIIVLEEGARKFMPPKTSGFTSVTPEEKAIIRQWIESGAP